MSDGNLHPTDDAMLRWVSGELIGEAAQTLEAHIAVCPACGSRLAGECALDVVMQAAGDLATETDVDVVDIGEARRRPAVAYRGWRQVLGAAAGFALLAVAGRGALDGGQLDAIATGLGTNAVVIADAPSSREPLEHHEGRDDAICETVFEMLDEPDTCTEPGEALVVMAMPTEPTTLWSVMGDSLEGDDDPCTTPVDTGQSLTCDDWLSTDDLSG